MLKRLCSLMFLLSLSVGAEAASLKLLSFNTFMIPKPINWTMQGQRAKQIAEKLIARNNDVMVFQETFSARARNILIKKMKEEYPFHERLKGKFLKLNSGLLLMSRYPMEVLESIHYKDCTTSDCLAAKGVVLVEITMEDGKKVHLATTHLQAWNTDAARAVRQKQLKAVKELFEKYHDEDIPEILAGDLNIDGRLPDLEYMKSLKLLGMESSELSANGPQVSNGYPVPCYKIPGGEANGEWLDHVWLKKNQTEASVTAKTIVPLSGILKKQVCPLSDHHAIEAVIEF